MAEYDQIRTEESDVWADLWLVEGQDGLIAQAYVNAPKQGDKIMAHLMAKLQQIANQRRRPVTHEFTPGHAGAVKLAQRTDGYEKTGEVGSKGYPLFARKFWPK